MEPKKTKRKKARKLTPERLEANAIVAGRVLRREHPDTPAGWTTENWVARLRYMSRVCICPKKAKKFSQEADRMEKR